MSAYPSGKIGDTQSGLAAAAKKSGAQRQNTVIRPASSSPHAFLILCAYPELMKRLLDLPADLPPGRAMAARNDELVADLGTRWAGSIAI
jgi:hypothetical protein